MLRRRWLLVRADDRAAVDFVGWRERDLTGRRCIGDFVVREQLPRCVAGVEGDLHLTLQRVEAVPLNRVEHACEHDACGLAGVAHEDGVDRTVVCEERLLRAAGLLLQVDGEELGATSRWFPDRCMSEGCQASSFHVATERLGARRLRGRTLVCSRRDPELPSALLTDRFSARNSANAGVVQQRRRCSLGAKSLKINKRFNAGVAAATLQNRGLLVRVQPGLFAVSSLVTSS